MVRVRHCDTSVQSSTEATNQGLDQPRLLLYMNSTLTNTATKQYVSAMVVVLTAGVVYTLPWCSAKCSVDWLLVLQRNKGHCSK